MGVSSSNVMISVIVEDISFIKYWKNRYVTKILTISHNRVVTQPRTYNQYGYRVQGTRHKLMALNSNGTTKKSQHTTLVCLAAYKIYILWKNMEAQLEERYRKSCKIINCHED